MGLSLVRAGAGDKAQVDWGQERGLLSRGGEEWAGGGAQRPPHAQTLMG